MRHILQCGKRCMEVDHFNPTLKASLRNRYENLMLATRLCNNFKQHNWPIAALQKKGVRFLNPTKEQDYGVQLFENAETHELIGTTPAARYHIDMLDLNNPSFVKERTDRAQIAQLLEGKPAVLAGSFAEISQGLQGFREMLARMIPPIPPLE